ncbi:cytochrome c oxidase subunit 3 [Methylocapsa acidiphila]|uniref:cytochrome c oxidase subunit 3 n=1 Tax=Methylocapsa acidiphila TaxID=133552 RepID=UPI0003F5EC58|nr:cytochrome c oxidase subunit 3 [Methylocapsa acidiphila]
MADAHVKPNHDYHLVDPSPWPIAGAAAALVLAIGAILWMKHITIGGAAPGSLVFGLGVTALLAVAASWWRDVIKESTTGGYHTPVVQIGLRYGMILFIMSEVMFFVAWFWAFFDASLFPGEAIEYSRAEFTGGMWPPKGTEVLDPWHFPLINTIILLTSGVTVTWAHHALLKGDRFGLKAGLALTILLGGIFTCVQAYEYAHAPFAFKGSIFGATFFMATGFHGFHVIVGTIFLAVNLGRALVGQLTKAHHLGFEFAAWYWHFVDVVWLFLFTCIYVWGSWGAAIEH